MRPSEKLLDFFRNEFQAEERSGFSRLSRIPNCAVKDLLAHYKSLGKSDRLSFIDCGAHWSHACFGFVIGAADFDHTKHPYYRHWAGAVSMYRNRTQLTHSQRSVPSLRATVQQYKIDLHRTGQSRISIEDFNYASSVQSVKAPELRKRIKIALQPVGYFRKNKLGYCCRKDGHQFLVRVSHGGPRGHHQLAYGIVRSEFNPKRSFAFESALGIVGGAGWDFIVEENVNDAMSLLADLVEYSFLLPERIRAAA